MSSSSSEEDAEEQRKLLDVVNSFQVGQKQEKKKEEVISSACIIPTNRPDLEEDNDHVMNTTPEFRNFLANKLSTFLEQSISTDDLHTNTQITRSENNRDGIHLLACSKTLISDNPSPPNTNKNGNPSQKNTNKNGKTKIKKRKVSSSSEDDLAKVQSVAVTFETVMQSSTVIHKDKLIASKDDKHVKKKKKKKHKQ